MCVCEQYSHIFHRLLWTLQLDSIVQVTDCDLAAATAPIAPTSPSSGVTKTATTAATHTSAPFGTTLAPPTERCQKRFFQINFSYIYVCLNLSSTFLSVSSNTSSYIAPCTHTSHTFLCVSVREVVLASQHVPQFVIFSGEAFWRLNECVINVQLKKKSRNTKINMQMCTSQNTRNEKACRVIPCRQLQKIAAIKISFVFTNMS